MSNRDNTKGKVILAAAGPGDPELITLKTLRYLGKADVVVIDRLVSADIIKHYINTEAIVIKVGKQAGKDSSTPQSTINNLLVEYALLLTVVAIAVALLTEWGLFTGAIKDALDKIKNVVNGTTPLPTAPSG